MNSKQQDDIVRQITKRKPGREPGTYGAEQAEPGDNARYLRYALVSLDLPPIDISDPQQVENRIREYFTYCADNDRKPSMIGMANWLGVDRGTVREWQVGTYRESTHRPVIKKAVQILEEMWVDYMQNGRVNPATGIFLGKNFFGYKDVQDVVVQPSNPYDSSTPEDTAKKYLEGMVGYEEAGNAGSVE